MLLRLDDTNPKMKEFLGGVTGGVRLGWLSVAPAVTPPDNLSGRSRTRK